MPIACASDLSNHRKSTNAKKAPRIWLRMNAGASTGRMPEKVSVSKRAIVTAGWANHVEAVNQ